MVRKRKDQGRSKGKGRGRAGYVTCHNCGARVPRDKAEKVTRFRYPIDIRLTRELDRQGAIIRKQKSQVLLCLVRRPLWHSPNRRLK